MEIKKNWIKLNPDDDIPMPYITPNGPSHLVVVGDDNETYLIPMAGFNSAITHKQEDSIPTVPADDIPDYMIFNPNTNTIEDMWNEGDVLSRKGVPVMKYENDIDKE